MKEDSQGKRQNKSIGITWGKYPGGGEWSKSWYGGGEWVGGGLGGGGKACVLCLGQAYENLMVV